MSRSKATPRFGLRGGAEFVELTESSRFASSFLEIRYEDIPLEKHLYAYLFEYDNNPTPDVGILNFLIYFRARPEFRFRVGLAGDSTKESLCPTTLPLVFHGGKAARMNKLHKGLISKMINDSVVYRRWVPFHLCQSYPDLASIMEANLPSQYLAHSVFFENVNSEQSPPVSFGMWFFLCFALRVTRGIFEDLHSRTFLYVMARIYSILVSGDQQTFFRDLFAIENWITGHGCDSCLLSTLIDAQGYVLNPYSLRTVSLKTLIIDGLSSRIEIIPHDVFFSETSPFKPSCYMTGFIGYYGTHSALFIRSGFYSIKLFSGGLAEEVNDDTGASLYVLFELYNRILKEQISTRRRPNVTEWLRLRFGEDYQDFISSRASAIYRHMLITKLPQFSYISLHLISAAKEGAVPPILLDRMGELKEKNSDIIVDAASFWGELAHFVALSREDERVLSRGMPFVHY